MDLSTTIAGVPLTVCMMNASGARCVTQEELEALGRSRAGAIVTKSMTPQPREGNPEPRYYSFAGGSINSMGLPNLGYPTYARLIPALRRFGKPIIASIAGLCEQDFVDGARALNTVQPDLMEINLSCPNLPGKPQIGYDFQAAQRLLRKVREVVTVPMGVKLPPYFDPAHHEVMASLLAEVEVDFLSVINSVGNALVVNPEAESVVIKPKGGFGGLGGHLIKPVALANVRAFWKLLHGRVTIIGTGGIVTGTDVFEHLLCGASAVQIGTTLVEEGLQAFDRIETELREVLQKKGYRSVHDCQGKLREL
ncbi:MAG: dihydroorotate oxidase [Nitrospirae bacterium]|nr:MAG: dihydroorotate oxidase [Nitrospirota bacterium]